MTETVRRRGTTEKRNQFQFMALVSADTLDRMDALRVATGVSRAHVARLALGGTSLKDQEMIASVYLSRLIAVAAKVGMTLPVFVRALVDGRRTGAPSLIELEKMTQDEVEAQVTPR